MKNNLILIILIFSNSFFFVNAQTPNNISHKYEKEESYRFYPRFDFKIETLNPVYRLTFIPKTYFLDVQLGVKIIDGLHFVTSYSDVTYYISDKSESTLRPNIFLDATLTGRSKHFTHFMLRYFPLGKTESFWDYLFVAGGYNFSYYKGKTESLIFNTSPENVESSYVHDVELYRSGPEVNLGLSYRFVDFFNNENRDNKKIIFSPEVLIGLYYTNYKVLKDEYSGVIGDVEITEYSESKIRTMLRLKLGVAF